MTNVEGRKPEGAPGAPPKLAKAPLRALMRWRARSSTRVQRAPDHNSKQRRARVPGSSSRPPVGQRAFALQRLDLGAEQLVVHGAPWISKPCFASMSASPLTEICCSHSLGIHDNADNAQSNEIGIPSAAPARTRGGGDLHHARSRGRVRQAGHALFDRQGFRA